MGNQRAHAVSAYSHGRRLRDRVQQPVRCSPESRKRSGVRDERDSCHGPTHAHPRRQKLLLLLRRLRREVQDRSRKIFNIPCTHDVVGSGTAGFGAANRREGPVRRAPGKYFVPPVIFNSRSGLRKSARRSSLRVPHVSRGSRTQAGSLSFVRHGLGIRRPPHPADGVHLPHAPGNYSAGSGVMPNLWHGVRAADGNC
jgi:hypothetical protein